MPGPSSPPWGGGALGLEYTPFAEVLRRVWISVVQMDVRTRDLEGKIDRAYRHVREASAEARSSSSCPRCGNGFAYPDLLEVARQSFQEPSRFMTATAQEEKSGSLARSLSRRGKGIQHALLVFAYG